MRLHRGGQGRNCGKCDFPNPSNKLTNCPHPGQSEHGSFCWGVVVKNLYISLLFALYFGTAAQAADLRYGDGEFCNWKLSGLIAPGDSQKIRRIQTTYGTRLCFDSPGGSLSESLKIFDVLWEKNVRTAVLPDDRCESACALAFLAGSEIFGSDFSRIMDRILWRGARLGFHGPSLNLRSDEVFADRDVNRAFGTALVAATHLFELNRRQDRGNRAMTDHLLHRWLTTNPASMYFIDTVGDAILADLFVAGVHYDIVLTTEHIQNVCDNVYLKGNYPAGTGLSSTIHADFEDTAALVRDLDSKYGEHLAQRRVWAEIRGDQVFGFVGPYPSNSTNHDNGCVVSFDSTYLTDSGEWFDVSNDKPIEVRIIPYEDWDLEQWTKPEADLLSLVEDVDPLQTRNVDLLYLYRFDFPINKLPASFVLEEVTAAMKASPESARDPDWAWTSFLRFEAQTMTGPDIQTLEVADTNDCALACLENIGCIGFVEPEDGGACQLKGQQSLTGTYRWSPNEKTHAKAEFAFRIAHDPEPPDIKRLQNKGFGDYPLLETLAESYDICLATCLSNQFCAAFTYLPAEDLCQQFENPWDETALDGADSGLKIHND